MWCPLERGEAEYGVRFLLVLLPCGFRRLGAEAAVIAEEGVRAEAGGHASWVKKLSMWSGWALEGYADWGCRTLPKGMEVSN
jgi:hypothetical protein